MRYDKSTYPITFYYTTVYFPLCCLAGIEKLMVAGDDVHGCTSVADAGCVKATRIELPTQGFLAGN